MAAWRRGTPGRRTTAICLSRAALREDFPLKPPDRGRETGAASHRLTLTSAFAASALFHSIISFIPSSLRWLYFTAQRLQRRDTRSHGPEMDVRAPALPPSLPSLFDVEDKARVQILASCLACLCRALTLGPVTMPPPRPWPTFLSSGRMEKTMVVLYFPLSQ